MSQFFKDKNSIKFKVGIFTIIVIAIFIVSYSYLNDLLDRHKYITIDVLFDHINNLELGSAVTVNGFKKGKVHNIRISEEGVITTLFVDLDFPLKQGTSFIAKESDIMGSHQVDIITGTGSEILDLKKIQKGDSREGFIDLIHRLNIMISNVENIFSKLENADDMLNNINKFIENSNSAFVRVDDILDSINENEIKTIITNLSQSTTDLNKFFSDNKDDLQLAIQNSNIALESVNYTLSTVDSAMVYLNQVAKNISNNNNSLGALVNDKELYQNLINSTQKVDSLLIDIKKNPRKYFRISVF